MNIPVIGDLINLGSTWIKGRQKKAEIKQQAESDILVNASKSVADWEALHAKGSQDSWKDEFWTIILAIPMVLCFIPGCEQLLLDGFDTLTKMPQWYQYVLVTVILASFGIRNVPKLFGKKN